MTVNTRQQMDRFYILIVGILIGVMFAISTVMLFSVYVPHHLPQEVEITVTFYDLITSDSVQLSTGVQIVVMDDRYNLFASHIHFPSTERVYTLFLVQGKDYLVEFLASGYYPKLMEMTAYRNTVYEVGLIRRMERDAG